ncbi:MAG: NFACT family protein [Lachnospiraceae bacterium]|nr:NFACT family protein [Lachnospiraceae bacterium]
MAFDGITVSCMTKELDNKITGGRIVKISQPEPDELLITLKNGGNSFRLLISADASLPLIYLTESNKPSPATAPAFCMLLRKHIGNAEIVSVSQPSLERIIRIEAKHLDEMGDIRRKTLIIELMGKHSNIIFTDENNMILDSIKHISQMVSSVREVLPGRDYFPVNTKGKSDPMTVDREGFKDILSGRSEPVSSALPHAFTGFSIVTGEELSLRAGIDSELCACELKEEEYDRLYEALESLRGAIKKGAYSPCIYYKEDIPIEFSSFPLSIYKDMECRNHDSISDVLEIYYREKAFYTRMRQKSSDLRKLLMMLIERASKKYDLQSKQMKDTDKMDRYKIWGELINTYGYSVSPGSSSMEAVNYYTGESITIPLDKDIPVLENAKKYFDRYGKLKRTREALTSRLKETSEELEHLLSIQACVDMAQNEEDLSDIKEEMAESGYINKSRLKGKNGKKQKHTSSKPIHYLSSDGYHMYVGKNNFQNDDITFNLATGNDLWFHSKKFPGSHVIVKTDGKTMDLIPDRVFEEAASLAAYYSKGSGQAKVEIDYIEKKHVKKPAGAKPGFVVYYTNYSLSATPDISNLRLL